MKPSPAALACAVFVFTGSARADFVEIVVKLDPLSAGCRAEFASAKAQFSLANNHVAWWAFKNTCSDPQEVTVCAPLVSPFRRCKGEPATTAIGTPFTLKGGTAAKPATAAAICPIDYSSVMAKKCKPGVDCPVYKFHVVNRADPDPNCRKCPPLDPEAEESETKDEAPPPRPCRRSYELSLEVVP